MLLSKFIIGNFRVNETIIILKYQQQILLNRSKNTNLIMCLSYSEEGKGRNLFASTLTTISINKWIPKKKKQAITKELNITRENC